MNMVKIGELAPNFAYIDRDGTEKQFHDLAGKKLVYFFPRVFTAVCTAQSCSLQDDYSKLKEHGIVEIFGISTDSKENQEKFSKKYDLDFILVSDPNHRITKDWGVLKNFIFVKVADRDTFIVDGNNVIIYILKNGLKGRNSELGLKNHGKEVLKYLDDESKK